MPPSAPKGEPSTTPADPPASDVNELAPGTVLPSAHPGDTVTTEVSTEHASSVTTTPAKVPPPFLSEGMRNDLESFGKAVDPGSGATFVLDRETRQVTVTAKDGQEQSFELETPEDIRARDVRAEEPAQAPSTKPGK